MGDDFGGTPNPLNPGNNQKPVETATKAESIPQPVQPQPVEPQSQSVKIQPQPALQSQSAKIQPQPAPRSMPVNSRGAMDFRAVPTDEFSELGTVTNLDGSVPEASLDPTCRPMMKVPTVIERKPRRMRKGCLIAMLVSVLVMAACGVTAILLIINNKTTDPVAKAVEKIVNGSTPDHAMLNGTMEVVFANEESSGLASLKMSVQSVGIVSSLVNATDVSLNLKMWNGEESSIYINGLYGGTGGDLYLKMDGVAQLLDGEDDGILSSLNAKWVRISANLLEQMLSTEDDAVSCTENLAVGLKNSRNTLAEIYNRNAFIVSSDKNVTVESRKNAVYEVLIDEEKFRGFLDGINGLASVTNFVSCVGNGKNKLDADRILEMMTKGVKIYAEINDNYDFTRLYAVGEFDGGQIMIDVDFSYPMNINISEPSEYAEMFDLMNEKTIEEVTVETEEEITIEEATVETEEEITTEEATVETEEEITE